MSRTVGFFTSVLKGTPCLFMLVSAACSSQPESAQNRDSIARESRSNANEEGQGGMPSEEPTPPANPEDDPDVRFVKETGFESQIFARFCRSVGADGSVIDGAGLQELPVGGGRVLECDTAMFPAKAAQEFSASTGQRWCALGSVKSQKTGGDSRLKVEVTRGPGPGAGGLRGTHEGEAITIRKVSAWGTDVWPLWIMAIYGVDVVQPWNMQKESCEAQFGIAPDGSPLGSSGQ